MERYIYAENINMTRYKNIDGYPCVELDYAEAIQGHHELADLMEVSNSICNHLIKEYSGTYNCLNGVGEVSIGKKHYKLEADSMFCWVNIISKDNSEDMTCLMADVKKHLSMSSITYDTSV